MDLHWELKNALADTPQDPVWHGEGSVWNHTELVCQAMETLPEFREGDQTARQVLGMAAALHDIGKIRTTRREDDRWTAPGHGRIGSEMARRLLWLDRGFCGTPEKQQTREAVCGLIRYHSLPVHAIDEPDGRLRLLLFAANGSLAPESTVKNLCALAKADILGRHCPDRDALLEKVELCAELAREAGCYEGPYPFPTDHTAYLYLSGREMAAEYPAYDSTWGAVILLSGLPGVGKDTWIAENYPDLPDVSLDEIRREQGIAPTENQSRVVELAREQAKIYLRNRQRFVWNATNLSPMVRGKQTGLFAGYGASVQTVYLETNWSEQLRRNSSRPDRVPEQVICDMLETLSPPERWEAHRVRWCCW